MRHLLTVLCLCLPALAWAGELKGDRTVKAGRLIILESDAKAGPDTRYSWRVSATGADGKVIEPHVFKSGGTLVTTAPAGATVRVDLTVVDFEKKLFDESSAVVTVEGAGPQPGPSPGPDPGPRPTPDSPLLSSLRSALAADLDAKKKEHCAALAEVYSQAAALAKKDAKTVGQVNKALLAGNEAAGLEGKLGTVKSVIASHCQKLPTRSSHELTDADRVLYVVTFADVADALKEVSK